MKTETHKLILVVDDSVDMRRFTARHLRNSGYDVFEACDGEEALSLLDKHDTRNRWFALVTDFCMPKMNGGSLIAALREKGMPFEKVILVSDHPDARSVLRQDEAIQHLPKPFGGPALVELLSSASQG